MENAQTTRSIDEVMIYQELCKVALPILVRQAHVGRTISCDDLAAELGLRTTQSLDLILSKVARTLKKLSQQWHEKIPLIECLVLTKRSALQGKGTAQFLAGETDPQVLSRVELRLRAERELQTIFSYRRWNDVLNALKLPPASKEYDDLLSEAGTFQSRGQGEQHEKLKEYVANNPDVIGVPRSCRPGQMEYPLPSGDNVDVLFRQKDRWTAVEVKSEISSNADLARGIFQCVKYEAVITAYQACHDMPQSSRVVLVLGSQLPAQLFPLKNTLGIEIVEQVIPK